MKRADWKFQYLQYVSLMYYTTTISILFHMFFSYLITEIEFNKGGSTLHIYWEEINTTGVFMSIGRITLKSSNVVARNGIIASKNSAFPLDHHYLILNKCM